MGEKEVQSSEKKGKGKVIWAAAAVVLVIMVAALMIWIRNPSGGSTADSLSKKAINLFHNGLVVVEGLNGKYGYIDKTGSCVIEPQFDSAHNFTDNGLAYVVSDDRYGYIDKTGTYVIEPQFDIAHSFDDNGLARVALGDKWGYIDKTGAYVANPQFDTASMFSDN